MNSVQFGARKNSQLLELGKEIAAQQAKQRAAEAKAALDVVKNADPNELLDVAQAVVTAQLGDKADFVKTIALGSEEEAGTAFINTLTAGSEKTANVAESIAENFGPTAGAVAGGLAQQGLGLVAAGLQLLRQGAQLAPAVLPAVADKAQKSFEGAAASQEKAAEKLQANAAEIKVVGGKVGQLLTALGARIGAAQTPEQGE